MKSLALVLALAACQSKSPPPAPAAGSAATGSAAPAAPPTAPPAVAHTAEICQASLGVIERATCPANDAGLRVAKTSLEGIVNTMTKTGGGDPATYDIMCARLLLALEHDIGAGSGKCVLPIDAELRGKVQRTLDVYFNQRTPVTKTGDTASDDAITKLASIRDAACDCRTSACIDALDAKMADLPTLSATAPQAAKDLAGKLLDDSSRCAQRARMNP